MSFNADFEYEQKTHIKNEEFIVVQNENTVV